MTIKDVENFFNLDLKIKQLIIASRPNLYNANPVDVEEELLKSVSAFKSMFDKMTDIYAPDLKEDIDDKMDKVEKDISRCRYNIDKLYSVYENDILNISQGLEESLKENISGYYVDSDIYKPFNKCNTVNDILHLLHFSITNDETIYHSLNVISSKRTQPKTYISKIDGNEYEEEAQPITLYGIENDMSKSIFSSFDENMDCEKTDILSFPEHTIMMIRGKGHALSIDIVQEENNNVRVSYFIPKVCNIDMVNNLPGVDKLDKNKFGNMAQTKGEFVAKSENIGDIICEFVKQVPTDLDIPRINFADVIHTIK